MHGDVVISAWYSPDGKHILTSINVMSSFIVASLSRDLKVGAIQFVPARM
ncbi:MAG: hypothetical protein SH808_05755 [Saprospiraceae bacterium]|nr:hypothetical protein [Saprospiraceae bacterium]